MIGLLREDEEIWDLFTRKEEYSSSFFDQHDRFPHYMSQHPSIFKPRASIHLQRNGLQAEYPDKQPFAVCLTHDVDHIYQPTLSKGIQALACFRRGHLSRGLEHIAQARSKKLPWCNFKEILALEGKYGAHSSFYFMALDKDDPGYGYQITNLEHEMGMIADAGSEIGLHGGYDACSHPDEIHKQKVALEKAYNQKIYGYRNHFLRFRIPDTWNYLCEAGFLYDSTLGYAGCAGFRNGMCHPFMPFNLTTGCEIPIWEVPLTIMDNTFYDYMKIDAIRAWKVTEHLIRTVEQYHGVITILWHNHTLQQDGLKFYENILRYCQNKGAWMASGYEIVDWWRRHV